MNMKATVLLLGLCLGLISTAQAADAPQMSIYEAINKAGYQRMLTQRIAKCYLSVVAKVDGDKYKDHLRGSAKIFKQNLRELTSFSPTDEIREQFRYIEILWRNYQFIYSDEYSVESAQVLLKFNDKILKACDKAVTMLEEYANTQNETNSQEVRNGDMQLTHIINISGSQRMLTQRILLYTIAQHYQYGDAANNNAQLQTAIETFGETYKKLMSYSNNTSEIDQQLMVVTENWQTLSDRLQTINGAVVENQDMRPQLAESLKLSEKILFAFDEIVFLYERQKS